MSVSSTTSSISYSGNASTSTAYPVPFQFIDATDLVVVVNTAGVPTTLVNGSGYTVSGGAGSTGSIVTTSAIPNTSTVIIARSTAKTQLTSYTTGDRFPASTHEKALDKLTMLVQEATTSAVPPTSSATGAAPFVLQAASLGASPTWVPQSSGGIAAGAITNTMLAGGITPGKLSTGAPVWDASGNLTASSFVGNASTASSAARLTTPRTIGLSGDVTGTASFDGSANATVATTIPNGTVTAAKLGTNEQRQICKAWINFDGTGTATTGLSATWSQSGTTVTVTTSSAHGMIAGQNFYSSAPQTGFFTVLAVTTPTVFTYTTTTTATNSGSSTIYKNFIRSSYNVSSITKNGTGDYTINFATAMADANYSPFGTVGATATAGYCFTLQPITANVTTTSCRFNNNSTYGTSGGLYDIAMLSVAIFGN